ncbi:MAG TPA: glycosyltransferase family 4 protein [Humisphaera sp.]|nr:glycosyltransferase family 4 protein [Humisphaera sp.]
MRRILLLNTDLELGGTPTVIRELATRLTKATNAHLEVACLATFGPIGHQIEQAGIKVTALNAAGALDLMVAARLIRLIRKHRIDTVFSFLVHANTMAAVASRYCRDVRFIQAIQTTQPRPRWHWPVQAAAQYAAERIVTPSHSVEQAARDWAYVPPEKIVVIPNAIDLPPAMPDFNRPVKSGVARIGFIGRLDPVKRVEYLVVAMNHVRGAHLQIFGAGERRAALEELIDQQKLADRVTLRGPSSGPMEALRQIDVLVLPSEAEGFPLVLIEAMATGVPIVATDAPGIRDVVSNGATALMVPVGSPTKLGAAIQRLVDDAPLRRRLATDAYAEVSRRFTWDRVLPQYMRLLQLQGA